MKIIVSSFEGISFLVNFSRLKLGSRCEGNEEECWFNVLIPSIKLVYRN